MQTPDIADLFKQLRRRIEELESQNYQLIKALGYRDSRHPGLALTPTQQVIYDLLMYRSIASYDQLFISIESVTGREITAETLKAHVCLLRRHLKPHRVRIYNRSGAGYFITTEDKRKMDRES